MLAGLLAALIMAACTVQSRIPARTVLLFSIGPVLAWAFWSYLTLAAWRAQRKRPPSPSDRGLEASDS